MGLPDRLKTAQEAKAREEAAEIEAEQIRVAQATSTYEQKSSAERQRKLAEETAFINQFRFLIEALRLPKQLEDLKGVWGHGSVNTQPEIFREREVKVPADTSNSYHVFRMTGVAFKLQHIYEARIFHEVETGKIIHDTNYEGGRAETRTHAHNGHSEIKMEVLIERRPNRPVFLIEYSGDCQQTMKFPRTRFGHFSYSVGTIGFDLHNSVAAAKMLEDALVRLSLKTPPVREIVEKNKPTLFEKFLRAW